MNSFKIKHTYYFGFVESEEKEISGKESMSFNYNPDLEDEQSRFRSFCKDPANASYCKKWMAEIVAEHPLDEFNFYPL